MNIQVWIIVKVTVKKPCWTVKDGSDACFTVTDKIAIRDVCKRIVFRSNTCSPVVDNGAVYNVIGVVSVIAVNPAWCVVFYNAVADQGFYT